MMAAKIRAMDQASEAAFKGTILTFLHGYPRGLPLGEFGVLYHQQNGQRLELAQHGYCSLRHLLAEMEDQVVLDETVEQPWVRIRHFSVHGPNGKKNPYMCKDPATQSDASNPPKSGPARPSRAHPLLLRTKKTPREAGPLQPTALTRTLSRLPVAAARARPRLTFSGRTHPPASRLPRLLSRLPCPGRLEEWNASGLKAPSVSALDGGEGGQTADAKRVRRYQTPVLSLPAFPMELASPVSEAGNRGFPLSPPARRDASPHACPAASVSLPFPSSTLEPLHHQEGGFQESLCRKDTPNLLVQSSPALLKDRPALRATSQFLEMQQRPLVSPGPETMVQAGHLPPGDCDLSAPRPVSEVAATAKDLHVKECISNTTLSFPDPNVQIEALPNNLSETRTVPSEAPSIPTVLAWPIPSSSPVEDISSSSVGQRLGSPMEKFPLDLFASVSPIPSTLPEITLGAPLRLDSVPADCDGLPETKRRSNQSCLLLHTISSPEAAEVTTPVTPDRAEEETFPLPAPQSQPCTVVGLPDSPPPSPITEEKVLESPEKDSALGNGSHVDGERPTHKLCIIL